MFPKRIVLLLAFIASLTFCGSVARAGEDGLKLNFTLGASHRDEPCTVTVSGRVLDQATGQPIPGARVRGHLTVWKYQAQGPDFFAHCPFLEVTADENGAYHLQFVTPLTTTGPMAGKDHPCVDASAPGYETRPVYAREQVTPEHTRYENFDISLERGHPVRGVIVDDANQPVTGARVSVQSGLNGDWSFFDSLGLTTTDENGRFELNVSTDTELVERNPWLEVSKLGYGADFYFGILDREDQGPLVLRRGGAIHGRVVDALGKGVVGCEVLPRWCMGTPIITPAQTGPDGSYVLTGVPGEAVIKDMTTKKNKRYMDAWAKIDLFARQNPTQSLKDVPTCQVTAPSSQTMTAPDLVIGNTAGIAGIAGSVRPTSSTLGLQGLLVRLDGDWDRMVKVDGDGKFAFPVVPAGKHRLTAYLPNNLRYDRGIGHTEIEVQPRQQLEGVTIGLEELAEARVQILDAQGKPLEGIAAGASWSRDGSGEWTEGTRSGADGWSVLYLYPGGPQYVRGFDMNGHKLLAGDFVEVSPKGGEVINNLRVTMVEPASLAGNAQETGGKPVAERKVLLALHYADGTQRNEPITTDRNGIFQLDQIRPGVAKISLETVSLDLAGSVTQSTEFKPGAVKDVGSIILSPVNLPELGQEALKKLVEDFFQHNFKDVTARRTVEWGEPVKEKDGSFSIRQQYEATIWDKEILMMNQVFTFNRKGIFVSYKNVEGFPKKLGQKVPDILKNIKVETKEGLMALVENFFKQNYHDITSRKTLEWGEPVKEQNGNYSIRYKAETMISDNEQKILDKVFTFDPTGNFVSVKDRTDQAAPGQP